MPTHERRFVPFVRPGDLRQLTLCSPAIVIAGNHDELDRVVCCSPLRELADEA
jgi:hypothetical protein